MKYVLMGLLLFVSPAFAGPTLDELFANFKAIGPDDCLAGVKEFQAGLKKQPGQLTDPDWINSLHLEAACWMKKGEWEKAVIPMNRVVNSGKTNRSILLNRSVLDLAQKKNVARVIADLKKYASSNPADETVQNLWGVAIYMAQQQGIRGTEQMSADYSKVDKQLELAKKKELEGETKPQTGDARVGFGRRLEEGPKVKRWGIEWISEAKLEDIEQKKQSAMREVRSAMDSLKNDEINLKRYESDLMHTSSADTVAKQRAESARARVESSRGRLKAAQERVPQPNWELTLEPVEPAPILVK